MRKRCNYHGEFVDLLGSHAAFHKRRESLAAPLEREYRPDEPVHDHGVLGVQYGTGTFIIFDLTNRCNMKCDPCYMDANAGQDVHELSPQDIQSVLERAAAVKSRREVNILFSGGEPTGVFPFSGRACLCPPARTQEAVRCHERRPLRAGTGLCGEVEAGRVARCIPTNRWHDRRGERTPRNCKFHGRENGGFEAHPCRRSPGHVTNAPH